MDKVTFEVNGFAELYKKFKTLDNKAKDEVKKEFAASALKIQSTAKRLSPVNFGNLRNSISVTESGSNTDFVYKINLLNYYALQHSLDSSARQLDNVLMRIQID